MNKRQRKKQSDRQSDAMLDRYARKLFVYLEDFQGMNMPPSRSMWRCGNEAADLLAMSAAHNLPHQQRPRVYRTAACLRERVFAKMYHVLSLLVVLTQAPECVKDRDCSSGQRCVGGACKVVSK